MQACEPYIYEFLYRGRPDPTEPDDPLPAWHLQLEARVDDGMGGVKPVQKIFTILQAEAAGWTLPQIISDINTVTLKALESERQRTAELENQIITLTDRLAKLDISHSS